MAKTISLARTIVGRERELAAVVQFLDLTSAEACALVIDGEAGIGKSRLVDSLVELAAGVPVRTLVGAADVQGRPDRGARPRPDRDRQLGVGCPAARCRRRGSRPRARPSRT